MSENKDSDGDEQPRTLMPQSGPDPDEMASDYLPESDDWLAKTVLDLNDPQAIAALSQFDTMFPEVEDMQPMIDDVLDQFLRGRTSVHGASRDEYRSIIESMFGGHPDDSGASAIAGMLAGEKDD